MRDVRLVGGSYERGTDIEYYEIMGPDKFRHYTGIQVKKKGQSISAATERINQGTLAFEKNIIDPASGRPHRLSRGIVATTGNISAKEEIYKHLDKYAKPVSFWDGLRVAELIIGYIYNESIDIMEVPPEWTRITSGATTMYDPDHQLEMVSYFAPAEWSKVDMSQMVPPTASGVYIAVKPTGGNFPPVKLHVRSSVDEFVVDAFASQVSPQFIRLEPGETTIEAMLQHVSQ